MEHFRTLHVSNNNHSGNALEAKYKSSEITSDMVVVRDVQNGEYLLFQSRDQFWEYYNSLAQDQKFLEEVIFGHLQQYAKFDIDIKDKSSDDRDAVIDILKQIINGIKDTIHGHYKCTIDDVIVLESSGLSKGKWKWSFHIHLPQYAFHDYLEAILYHVLLVHHYLPESISKYVDNVNKSTQNFRMYGSSKLGEKRPFILSPLSKQLGTLTQIRDQNHLLVTANTNNFFRTNTTVVTNNSTTSDGESHRQSPNNDLVRGAIALAEKLQISNGFKYRDTISEKDVIFINFDRSCPTHCSLCNETHHRDNTLYLVLSKKGHEWAIYESCRHHKGSKWLGYLDGEGNVVHHDTKMTMQELLTDHINDLNNNVVDSSKNVDSSSTFGISNIKEYNKPSMKNYKLVETLLVRAQMGMGKTRALRNYIDKYFSGNGKVIRFVTF